MASASENNATDLSRNSRESGQHQGSDPGGGGVWTVVKDALPNLRTFLDISELDSYLYSAGLINFDESHKLKQSDKSKAEHTEDLLEEFISRGNEDEFDCFLRILESVQKYHQTAADLKEKANQVPRFQSKQTSSEAEQLSGVGGGGGMASPWQVVKAELPNLKKCLDMNELRSHLWSASLISHELYCGLGLSQKTKPEKAAEVLMGFLERDIEQEFYHFLGVLESVPTYRHIAKGLKTKAGQVQGIGDRGSQVYPFVVVRRLRGELCNLEVDGKTIDKINGWETYFKPSQGTADILKTQQENTDTRTASLSSSAGNANQSLEDPDLRKSKNLLSKIIKLPVECKEKGNARVVVLAGEVTEIVAWLRENEVVTEEQELGKIIHFSMDDAGATVGVNGQSVDAIMTSGIFCVLPQDDNTLYVVVRLRWMDEPEVQLRLLRIALELSPVWLIFYSKDGIEQNGFCVEAYREPSMPAGEYFSEESFDVQKTTEGLVNQLWQVISDFPYGNNFVQPLSVLHIQYVFDVSLPFFSSTMVYHNPLMEDSQAKCTVLTYEIFAVESNSRTKNAEIAQIQQGMPDLTVGVSLRRELKPTFVEAYPVDLRWWLQMSSSYVEVAMLSCSSTDMDSLSVCCTPFPEVQTTQPLSDAIECDGVAVELSEGPPLPCSTKVSQQVDENTEMPSERIPASADNAHSQEVSKNIRKAMETMTLPPSLTHTFLKWRGPVQTIACVAADVKTACSFLNKLTGSNLGLFTSSSMSEGASDSRDDMERHTSKGHGQRQYALSSSVSTSTSHSHFPVSRVWMCCRPSDAVLYVLMCFDGLSLAAAACPDGLQESAALFTAAALANMFVVLTEGLPQDIDILESLLLPGLRHFGRYIPGRGKHREEQLFNGVLVPIVAHADLKHKCTSRDSCTKCTEHFRRICVEKSWNQAVPKEHLKHYFVGVQPSCSRNPARTVAKLLSESRLFHKSGSHFQKMLRLILAAVKVQGQGDIKQLEHLLIEGIMEGEWIEFQKTLKMALTYGEAKGEWPSSHAEVSCVVDLNGKKVNVTFPSTLKLSWLEGDAEREVWCSEHQQDVRQDILKTTASACCKQLYEVQQSGYKSVTPHDKLTASVSASYKSVRPDDLLTAFVSAVQGLVTHRTTSCTTWWKAAIEKEPFNTSDGAKKKCREYISKFEQQWEVCGEQCKGSFGHKCFYHCLLPANHSENVLHNCLDPEKSHACVDQCKFCKLDTMCTKPAGHQHVGSYDNRLHKCDNEHLCEDDCSFSASRTCTAKTRPKDDSRPGKCHYRTDHYLADGYKAKEHICTVSRNDHKCEKPCELSGTSSCKDGYCSRVFGHIDGEHHLCDKQHTCEKWCDQPGVCMRARSDGPKDQGDRKQLTKGKDGWKLRCQNKQIPSGKYRHDGFCSCGRQHTCDKPCPFCSCYCKKEYNHGGPCDVEHGEICTEMEVLSNISKAVVQVEEGARRCDEICVRAGRGHEHRLRRERRQPELVPHEKFWQQHNLVDPNKKSNIDFGGCPEACQHSDHSKSDLQVFCTERLKHEPLSGNTLTSKFSGKGYISHKRNNVPVGHHFLCDTHKCSDSGGVCKKKINGGKDCDKPCSLKLGHPDVCTCGDKHECGRPCAAWKCNRKCTILSEKHHNTKDCSCQEGGCTQDCELCESPKMRCCSEKHLHRPSDFQKHYCKEEHPCKAMCEKRGICALSAPDKKPEHAVFKRKGINGLTLNCSLKQPVGMSGHFNEHSCGRKHTCDKRCPLCGYYCELRLDHPGDCKTHHGPVLAKSLVGLEGRQIITADKKEVRIEEAITCDQICHQAGRGHSHILKCNCKSNWSSNLGLSQKKSQSNRSHYTDASGGSDLASHSEFWKLLASSFADPAPTGERREFELCGVQCPRCIREGKPAECTEAIHHKPPDWEGYTGQGFVGPKAHVGIDRHRFSSDGHMCKKTCTTKPHYFSWNECGKLCDGQEGHQKKCQCEKHWGLCGEPCDVAGCKSTCDIEAAQEHKVHKCKETGCKISSKCQFDKCTKPCARGHGHALAKNDQELSHHCGQQHSCPDLCNSAGFCFRDAKKHGNRRPCKLRIQVGMKKHDGNCSCEQSHACPALCPLCNQLCKYDVDHQYLHDFDHGKVVHAEPKVQDNEGRVVNAKGSSCDRLCKAASRGHTHPLPLGVSSTQARAISLNGSYVTHSYFWAHHGTEDPLQHDAKSMACCPAVCPVCRKNYCNGTSPWHPDMPGNGVGSKRKEKASWLGEAVHHQYPCH